MLNEPLLAFLKAILVLILYVHLYVVNAICYNVSISEFRSSKIMQYIRNENSSADGKVKVMCGPLLVYMI